MASDEVCKSSFAFNEIISISYKGPTELFSISTIDKFARLHSTIVSFADWPRFQFRIIKGNATCTSDFTKLSSSLFPCTSIEPVF